MTIRILNPGQFLTKCPVCDTWLNIPQVGAPKPVSEAPEDVLKGPLNCTWCLTDMVLYADRIEVTFKGHPKKRRPAPPKPVKVEEGEKAPVEKPKFEDDEDQDPEDDA